MYITAASTVKLAAIGLYKKLNFVEAPIAQNLYEKVAMKMAHALSPSGFLTHAPINLGAPEKTVQSQRLCRRVAMRLAPAYTRGRRESHMVAPNKAFFGFALTCP